MFSIFFKLYAKLLIVVIHFKQWHLKQICQKQQGFLMNFNALLLARILLHPGTVLTFYDNTPWLSEAFPFNYTSLHLRRDPTRDKVGRWEAVRRQTDCFDLISFNSVLWLQKGCRLPAHSGWLPSDCPLLSKSLGTGAQWHSWSRWQVFTGRTPARSLLAPFSPHRYVDICRHFWFELLI